MSVDLRTEINDCEASATTFTTSGSALADEALAGQFYEGTAAVRAQHSNNDDELYTTTNSAGTGLNINMNDVTAYVLLKDALPQTFANRGVQILLGDGTDRIGYSVGGNDAQGMPVGPFYNVYKLDVSEIVATPGTNFATYAGSEANLNQGAVSEFGIGTFHNAKAQGNVANLALDRMTYHANGSYALRINGGTVGTPETMADVQGDDVTNGWGLIANPVGEQYWFFGPTEWGNPAATADVYFSAANEQWFWVGDNAGGRAVGATHFPFRVVGNATDTISFVLDNVVIVNTGTRAELDLSDANVDIMQLDAVTFTDIGAITMPTQVVNDKYCNNSIFNNCAQVNLQNLDCVNLTFNGTTDANGAIIWDADDNSEQNQDDLTFNSDGTGHAIYINIDTASATTFDIDGYIFDGYAGQTGTAGNRVFYINNPSDGDITINLTNCQALNIQGGGSGFSFELAAGTTSNVTIQQSVTVTIKAVDTLGVPIQNAKVFLETGPGGTASISHVGTDAVDAGASATSVTLSEPAGTQEDDLILVIVKNDATTSNWTPPADFTQIDEATGTANQRFWVGYKVRGATQGNGYTFSHDFGAGTNTAGMMAVYRDENTSVPLDVAYVQANHKTDSVDDLSYAPSAITTVTNNAWVVILSGWSGGPGTVSWAGITGYTTDGNLEGGSGRNLNILSKLVATAGTETPGSFGTTGDAGEDGTSFTIAIRPGTTSTGGDDIIPYDVTDALGEVTVSYAGNTPQAVRGYVRKGTSSPVYKTSPINDTIQSTGLSATITLVSDE